MANQEIKILMDDPFSQEPNAEERNLESDTEANSEISEITGDRPFHIRHNSLADSATESDIDGNLAFNDDIEFNVRNNFAEERDSMAKWINDLARQMDIMSEMYQIHDAKNLEYVNKMKNENTANMESTYRKLDDIHQKVRRRNNTSRTSFIALFELKSVMSSFNRSLFLEPLIHTKLSSILKEWINGPSFFPDGFHRVTGFLRGFYGAVGYSLKQLYSAWKESSHYTYELEVPLRTDQNYLHCIYFKILKDSIEDMMRMNSNYIPSLIELGQDNIHAFCELLEKFDIPVAGPFKKQQTDGQMKLQFFLSNCNQSESIINCDLPIYGIYEFRLGCLRMRNDEALTFVNSLPTMPFWINHMPPIFNNSIDTLKRQISFV